MGNEVLKALSPYNLWYEMENGLYEEIIGKVVSGFWQPIEIKFYGFLPVGQNNFEWIEIEKTLAVNVNWNKVIDLIEEKIAADELKEKQIRKIKQLLIDLQVIVVQQTPQTTINGQVVQTVEQLVISPDYLMTYDDQPQDSISIIDIDYDEKKEDTEC